MQKSVASIALVALLLGASHAVAAPVRRVELRWSQSDAACIGSDALAATVERTLGRPVFHSEATPAATLSGEIAPSGRDRYEAKITLRGRDGAVISERVLSTEGDCQRLDESVAVVVALMVDGLEEAPAPLVVPKETPRPLPPPRPPFGLALGLGGGASASLLPKIAAMFVLRGEIAPPDFVPVAVTMRVHAPSSATVDGIGGSFTAFTGEAAICPGFGSSLRAGVCGGAGAGVLSGSPMGGLVDTQGFVRPLFFASVLPYASVRIAGRLWLRAEAGVTMPLSRERWGFVDAGTYTEVHRAGVVVPMGALSVEFRTGS